MGKPDLDQRLREAAFTEDIQVPDKVRQRVRRTLQSLPSSPGRHSRFMLWPKLVGAVSVSLIAAVIIAASVSPSAAQMFSRIPWIGSVFQIVGDSGLRSTSDLGLAENVNMTVSDQHIDITLNEVIYDGTRLSIGLLHPADTRLMLSLGKDTFMVDGTPLRNYGAGMASKSIDDDWEATVIMVTPHDPLPEEFALQLQFNEVSAELLEERISLSGNWFFETEVSIIDDIRTIQFASPLIGESEEAQIAVKEVTLTPITTQIKFDWIVQAPLPVMDDVVQQPAGEEFPNGAKTAPPPPPGSEHLNEPMEKTVKHLSYWLMNDQGVYMEPISAGGHHGTIENGKVIQHYTALFSPAEDSTYLILRPVIETFALKRAGPGAYVSADEPVYHYAAWPTELPLTLEQGEAGSITVTDIQFYPNETRISYEVDGHNPYVQDGALWLEDSEGNEYKVDYFDRVRTDSDQYKYVAKLPPLEEAQLQYIKTVELRAPELIPGLEIHIPLPSF